MRHYHLTEERIVQAAFWDKKRKKAIPSGPFHNLARLPTDDRQRFLDGYLTDTGRFLNRREARDFVNPGYLDAGVPDNLWSEDLWGLGHDPSLGIYDPDKFDLEKEKRRLKRKRSLDSDHK